MKTPALIIACLLALGASAQQPKPEFQSDSEFLYNQAIMDRLASIVDSLNIRFRSCGIERDYQALPQAMAHYFSVTSPDADQIAERIDNGLTFEAFQKEFPGAIEYNHLVVRFEYVNYHGNAVIDFSTIAIKPYSEKSIERDADANIATYVKNKWLYDHWADGEYSSEGIRGFYFTENFREPLLNEKYARMIQYSDCMVDTSATVMIESEKKSTKSHDDETPVSIFLDYVDTETNRPAYLEGKVSDKEREAYYDAYYHWDSTHLAVMDEKLSADSHFLNLLEVAVTYSLDSGVRRERLETYAWRYLSPSSALELKRRRKVYGTCSMDQRPRLHAKEIAELSAEVANWEVFLRSHLDLMNDRFERMSDGSYAQPYRQTYIRELEALDINTMDLMLGISLRYQDPHPNHYYGSIARVGRALSESEQREAFVSEIKLMCADTTLDDYNRVLAYFLLLNQAYHRLDEADREAAIADAQESVALLPEHFRVRFEKARKE